MHSCVSFVLFVFSHKLIIFSPESRFSFPQTIYPVKDYLGSIFCIALPDALVASLDLRNVSFFRQELALMSSYAYASLESNLVYTTLDGMLKTLFLGINNTHCCIFSSVLSVLLYPS